MTTRRAKDLWVVARGVPAASQTRSWSHSSHAARPAGCTQTGETGAIVLDFQPASEHLGRRAPLMPRPRTGLGKSDRPGSSGGSEKHGVGRN
jgi:hypothetical protein